MGTELTTTNQSTGQLTQWSKSTLPEKLDVLVSSQSSLATMPVVGPKSAAALQEFFDHPEPPLADDSWIEKQLVAFSVKPRRHASALEEEFKLELFVSRLRPFPKVDLGYAFGRLMNESKFYPDISEFIALAKYPAAKRAFKKHQAWKLLHKHKTEWREPIPEDQLITPEETKRITAEVAAEFAARNPNKDGRDEEQAA